MTGKSRAELVVDLLGEYSTWVGLLSLAVFIVIGGMIALGGFPTITVSPAMKVFAVAVITSALLGYAPVSRIIRWLYDPPKRYVVCLGFTGEPGIWELSPAAWESVDVVEGELYRWPDTTWPIYEAERFDPESMLAVGTWRGSEPDRELLRTEKKVDHLRNRLEEQAETSIDTEISISSRVRQAVKEIGQAIIDEHASATTYNGERVADVLSEIRQEVEEDAGDPQPRRNGEKPVREHGNVGTEESLEALEELVATGDTDD